MDAQSRRRAERAEREKRLEGLAVRVLVAVRERDAVVAAAEHRAGEALRVMTEDEGLSVREAVQWCGDEVTTREATRLRRLVDADGGEGDSTPGTEEGLGGEAVLEDAPSARGAAERDPVGGSVSARQRQGDRAGRGGAG